jgi:hypothetical protein
MSRVLSLAGFQVTLIGRFWVIPEVSSVTLAITALLDASLASLSFFLLRIKLFFNQTLRSRDCAVLNEKQTTQEPY